ncbi:MAG: spore coat protein [Oscillospiraceae bacterium]|jgi:rubrerythrin|nr:spore coat protein [Oscillospiraceae bacterium]
MPNISTKELSAIEDQIGQEQTLVKKYQYLAQMSQDKKIQKSMDEFAQKHQKHADTLLTFLN